MKIVWDSWQGERREERWDKGEGRVKSREVKQRKARRQAGD